MSPLEQILARREEILTIATKHGAQDVRLFGSVARGEEQVESDIDFLVAKTESTSPWFPASLVLDLQTAFNDHSVDVIVESGLNPYLRDQILNEAIPL